MCAKCDVAATASGSLRKILKSQSPTLSPIQHEFVAQVRDTDSQKSEPCFISYTK